MKIKLFDIDGETTDKYSNAVNGYLNGQHYIITKVDDHYECIKATSDESAIHVNKCRGMTKTEYGEMLK